MQGAMLPLFFGLVSAFANGGTGGLAGKYSEGAATTCSGSICAAGKYGPAGSILASAATCLPCAAGKPVFPLIDAVCVCFLFPFLSPSLPPPPLVNLCLLCVSLLSFSN
jgi:hypothetical protein